MWRGELPVGRVGRLAAQLPDGARVWKALGLGQAWTIQEHLTATVADILSWANFQRGDGKGQQPKPLPRPADLKAAAAKAAENEALAIEMARRARERTE